MSGKTFSYETVDRPLVRNKPILTVDRLTKAGEYADVSFSLYPGEILGLTGLLGSGPHGTGTVDFRHEPAGQRHDRDRRQDR